MANFEQLKGKLTEDTYNSLAEQLKDEKDLFVGFGNFIPHSRLKEESDKVKELQAQLAERDKQLAELAESNKSNAELKAQIEKLTAENQKAAENYEKNLTEIKVKHSVFDGLKEAGAKHPELLQGFVERDKLTFEGEKLNGFEEQLKGLKEKYPDLFAEKEPIKAGKKIAPPPDGDDAKMRTAFGLK